MNGLCPPNEYEKEEGIPIAPSNYSDEELIKHIEHYYDLDDNLQMLLNRLFEYDRERTELQDEIEYLENGIKELGGLSYV